MDQSTGEHQIQEEQNFYRPEEAAAPEQAARTPEVSAAQPDAVYSPDQATSYPDSRGYAVPSGTITWTASEFIDHQKTGSWYVMLGVGGVLLAALIWLVTRDFFPATAVFVGVILLGVYAAQKPRQETYALDDYGLTIGNRHYPYSDFRSFTIVSEGAFLSVELTPTKRFAMYVSMYFDPADEDRILERLCAFVPMEERRASLTDSMMRRIRF